MWYSDLQFDRGWCALINAWCKGKFESLIAWVQDFKPIMCLKNVIKLRQKPIGFRLRSKKTQMNSKAKSKMFGFSSACVFQQFSGVRRSPLLRFYSSASVKGCTKRNIFLAHFDEQAGTRSLSGEIGWGSNFTIADQQIRNKENDVFGT